MPNVECMSFYDHRKVLYFSLLLSTLSVFTGKCLGRLLSRVFLLRVRPLSDDEGGQAHQGHLKQKPVLPWPCDDSTDFHGLTHREIITVVIVIIMLSIVFAILSHFSQFIFSMCRVPVV